MRGAMSTEDKEPTGEERLYGAGLHPRHESWARLSVRRSLIGFVIFLVLAGMFVLWIGIRH
jgi:cell division septal protein FtsQ